MELLKRLDESNTGEEDLDDEEEEEEALLQRLKAVDLGMSHVLAKLFQTYVPELDSVSPDDLWDLLPEEQRSKFLKMVEDPSSEMAQQLLADSGLLHKQFTPWWNSHEDPSVKRPTMMKIPRAMVEGTPKDGLPLHYNICAVV